jgi:hypothetical protein
MVSINPSGDDDRPARNSCALASRKLSRLLALEVAEAGRASANPVGIACPDPEDECRERALGCAPRIQGENSSRERGIFFCKSAGQRRRQGHLNSGQDHEVLLVRKARRDVGAAGSRRTVHLSGRENPPRPCSTYSRRSSNTYQRELDLAFGCRRALLSLDVSLGSSRSRYGGGEL